MKWTRKYSYTYREKKNIYYFAHTHIHTYVCVLVAHLSEFIRIVFAVCCLCVFIEMKRVINLIQLKTNQTYNIKTIHYTHTYTQHMQQHAYNYTHTLTVFVICFQCCKTEILNCYWTQIEKVLFYIKWYFCKRRKQILLLIKTLQNISTATSSQQISDKNSDSKKNCHEIVSQKSIVRSRR